MIFSQKNTALVSGIACLAAASAGEFDFYAFQHTARGADPRAPATALALRATIEDHRQIRLRKGTYPMREWPALEMHPLCDGGQYAQKASEQWNNVGTYNRWPVARVKCAPICFGEIQVSEADAPELLDYVTTYGCRKMTLTYKKNGLFASGDGEEPTLDIWATRYHPGVLIRTGDDTLALFADVQSSGDTTSFSQPRFFAVGGAGAPVVKNREHADELPLDSLDSGWLLVWWGKGSFMRSSTLPGLGNLLFNPYTGLADENLYQADCPLLLLFENSPVSIGAEMDCTEFVFGGCAGHVTVIPVLGARFPEAGATEAWARDGLPAELVEKCAFWAKHSQGFPVGVSETYSYDATNDTVTLVEKFSYEPARAAGELFAPVPPFALLAASCGMAISLPENARELCLTAFGPFAVIPGASEYSLKVAGMGEYVPPTTVAAARNSEAVSELRDLLAGEAQKILDAGHLAPWQKIQKNAPGWGYCCHYMTTVHLIHENPGETLYFLSRALPYLPEDLGDKVKAYLREERETFPPETVARLPSDIGARREPVPATLSRYYLENGMNFYGLGSGPDRRALNFYITHKLMPRESVYHLAYYYRAVGTDDLAEKLPGILGMLTPHFEYSDWATGGQRHYPGQEKEYTPNCPWWQDDQAGVGGAMDGNRIFNSALGVALIGRLLNDKSVEEFGMGLLARSAMLRMGQGRLKRYFYDTGLLASDAPDAPGRSIEIERRRRPLARIGPDVDPRSLFILTDLGPHFTRKTGNEGYNALIFECFDIGPELGRFLRKHLRDEVEKYYAEFIRDNPHWFIAWDNHSVEPETDIAYPQTGWQIFLAQAYVLDAEPGQLAGWLDVPWLTRGDLYYLDKLVTVMDSHAKRQNE